MMRGPFSSRPERMSNSRTARQQAAVVGAVVVVVVVVVPCDQYDFFSGMFLRFGIIFSKISVIIGAITNHLR